MSAFYEEFWPRVVAHATDRPTAAALEFVGQRQVTYAAFVEAVELASENLLRSGARRLALVSGRTAGLAVGMVAALRSGVDLALVDPSWPEQRRQKILRIIAPDVIATGSDDVVSTALDLNTEAFRRDPVGTSGRRPAYFVATSGSSGEPKIIAGNPSGLVTFVRWQSQAFEINSTDRFAALTGPGFDVVYRDVLTPLFSGACVVHPSSSDTDLPAWIADSQITCLHTVPSLARAYLLGTSHSPGSDTGRSLRWTFFAGEPLDGRLIRSWQSSFDRTRSVNLYGPSETTLAAVWRDVTEPEGDGPQPAGAPVPGTIVRVFDESLRPVASGEVGKVGIHKPDAAHGYISGGSPETFVTIDGTRFFFPADLGSISNGVLTLNGREDDEVKISGVRVNPAAVAAAIRADHAVVDVAVVVLKEPLRIVAFTVLAENIDDLAALRDRLRGSLAAPEMPSQIHPVRDLPLLPNGKIDAQKLKRDAEKYANRAAQDVSLSDLSPLERRVAEELSRVLGVAPTNNLDFLEAGGGSLTATAAALRLEAEVGRRLTAVDVLTLRTPAKLAEHLSAAPQVESVKWPTATYAAEGAQPLSPPQRRYWAAYGPPSPPEASVMRFELELPSNVKPSDVASALRAVIMQFDALRTAFTRQADGTLAQEVRPVDRVSGLVEQAFMRGGDAAGLVDGWAPPSLDVSAPLFRFALQRTAEDTSLKCAVHHMIFDGLSKEVLGDTLRRQLEHPDGTSPGAGSYREFTTWSLNHERELVGKTRAEEMADLALPMYLPRNAAPTYGAGEAVLTLPTHVADGVQSAARAVGGTPFALITGVYAVLCSDLYEREEVLIGSPLAGRGHPRLQGALGMFLSMGLMRVRGTSPDLVDLVTQVNQQMAASLACEHEHLDTLEASLGLLPEAGRVQLTGAFLSTGTPIAAGARVHHTVRHRLVPSKVILDVMLRYSWRQSGELDLVLLHGTDVVTPPEAIEAVEALATTLRRVARGSIDARVEAKRC